VKCLRTDIYLIPINLHKLPELEFLVHPDRTNVNTFTNVITVAESSVKLLVMVPSASIKIKVDIDVQVGEDIMLIRNGSLILLKSFRNIHYSLFATMG